MDDTCADSNIEMVNNVCREVNEERLRNLEESDKGLSTSAWALLYELNCILQLFSAACAFIDYAYDAARLF